MEHYDEYCRLVDTELAKIAKAPELNANLLKDLGCLLDAKKDLLDIKMKEQELMSGGQSMRYMPREPYYGESYRGESYRGDGYYGNSMGNMGGQSMRQEPYGYRMNSQIQDDMVRQTMNKLYN